eukprot:GHVU01125546.1.p1 GENE.GHVU01125546.1~~GHVU01125546.1.p1  ORF type:complete len:149 (+),score=16.68 GHVU01125546.1:45-491(+)
MKLLRVFIGILFVLASSASASELSKQEYAEAEKYIIECASDWANTVVSGDMSRRKIYFAEDFVGTEPDGTRYGKAQRVNADGPSKVYVSNEINNIKVTFFGETAVAHGDEVWVKKDGTTGRWVWTDVWVRRDGTWQMVAAQDANAPVK